MIVVVVFIALFKLFIYLFIYFSSSNGLSAPSKSATLPSRTHEKKSLLDDSVLGDCMQEETQSSKFIEKMHLILII